MALQNNPYMYTGGKVNLNPLPYVQIAMQQRARKQAQDEAINKYYENLPNTINDKGIRDQEIPVLNDIKDKIYKYGIENRAILTNPRHPSYGAAKLEMDRLFREGKATVQSSLNDVATKKKLSTILTNPKFDYLKNDKETQGRLIQDIAASDLPVNDPNYKPLDLNAYLQEPPTFDNGKYLKGFADIKQGEKVSTAVNPQDKNYLIETRIPEFDEKAKRAIYQRAANDLVGNYAFEKQMKKDLVSNPNLIADLHKTFEENYGREVSDETKEADLAAAYTLMGLGTSGTKQKNIPNINARNAESDRRSAREEAKQKRLMATRFNYSTALKDYTVGKNKEADESVLNTFIDNTYKNGTESIKDISIDGKKYEGKFVDIPKDIKDKYIVDKGYKTEAIPDKWVITDDKKFVIPIFLGDVNKKTGMQALKVNQNSKPISMQNFKAEVAKLLLTQSKRGGEIIDQFDDTPDAKPVKKDPLNIFN